MQTLFQALFSKNLGNAPGTCNWRKFLRIGIFSWMSTCLKGTVPSHIAIGKWDGMNLWWTQLSKLLPLVNWIKVLVEDSAWKDQVFSALDQCGNSANYMTVVGWLLSTALEAKLKHTLKAWGLPVSWCTGHSKLTARLRAWSRWWQSCKMKLNAHPLIWKEWNPETCVGIIV